VFAQGVLTKNPLIYDVSLFNLEICLVGVKPTKAPCGDGTGYQETSISKTVLPNHAKFIKMRATSFLSFSC